MFAVSCGGSDSISLPREDLFFLTMGSLENQFNSFFSAQAVSNFRDDILLDDDVFYIINGSARKLMEFTLFGELTLLLYNPRNNPVPVLLPRQDPDKDKQVIVSRRAIETDLSDPGRCSVDAQKNIYIEDIAPEDAAQPQDNTRYARIIKRFDRLGAYIDFIGATGRNGAPFPDIEDFFLTKQDELVVISRSAKGRFVYWFDAEFTLLYEVEFDNTLLPLPEGSSAVPMSWKIVPDYHERLLYLMISYFTNVKDPSTRLTSRVIHTESRIHTFNLDRERYEDSPLILPAELSQKNDPLFSQDKQQSALPYQFLGVTENNDFFLLKMRNETSYELLSINARSKMQKHMRLSIDDTNILSLSFKISRQGVLYALILEKSGARIVRWRSDRMARGTDRL